MRFQAHFPETRHSRDAATLVAARDTASGPPAVTLAGPAGLHFPGITPCVPVLFSS